MENNIPDWVLERFLLKELPGVKMQEIEHQLAEDPGLQQQINNLQRSNAEILGNNPSESVLPEIYKRLDRKHKDKQAQKPHGIIFKRMIFATPVLALAVILLIIYLPGDKDSSPLTLGQSEHDITRVKGTQGVDLSKTHMLMFRKGNETIEELKSGDIAGNGDLVQLAYVAVEEKHGVIFSIDGNGLVTLHFPNTKFESTLLEQDKKINLPNAYELDAAPEFERFFFITSDSLIDVAEILSLAKILSQDLDQAKTEELELEDVLKQSSILLVKEETR